MYVLGYFDGRKEYPMVTHNKKFAEKLLTIFKGMIIKKVTQQTHPQNKPITVGVVIYSIVKVNPATLLVALK